MLIAHTVVQNWEQNQPIILCIESSHAIAIVVLPEPTRCQMTFAYLTCSVYRHRVVILKHIL